MNFQVDVLLNSVGIILEIVGFVIILIAVRGVKPTGGGIKTGLSRFQYVVATLHPRSYVVGICLVIVGLVLQLLSSLYR